MRGRKPRLALILGLTLALSLIAGCGEPTKTTPSPEAVDTAEAIATRVMFDAEFSATPVAGADQKQITLDGRIFGDGPTGVILAHMRPSDQTSWFPFATRLAADGEFTALTFDFRGYGDSAGDKEFDKIDLDVEAAYRYMTGVRGIKKVFLVGASMGGTASLIVGAEVAVAGVVTISAPADFQYLDALEPAAKITAPKLFVSSEGDVPANRSQEQFMEVAPDPKEQVIYPGDAHGTTLLDGDYGPALEAKLLAFLKEH